MNFITYFKFLIFLLNFEYSFFEKVEVSRDGKMLSMMVSGKLFGELAILYNCKRCPLNTLLERYKDEKCLRWQFSHNTGISRTCVYIILQDGNDQGGNELQAVGNWQGKLPDNHDAVRPREADKVHLLP